MNTMKKCSTCDTLFAGDLCPKCMVGFAQKASDPSAATQEDLPLKPGQTFHGLEIVELLGRGGMGVVYKAKQPALDRLVALKILPQKMALDPDFQNRFIREAKALGSLNHPNLVAVYDFGAENGLFFFVMEFVDGVNLRQVFRERKLTPEQGLKIIPQLCDALEYAHSEGVVHRDIKPENIMIDRKGRVKIADFGLAKLTGADQPAMLTMTNMVMGTPHYMAPEQVENPKQVDHRADIYSMGVVFYEMLTGELPLGRFEPPSHKVQVDVRLDEIVLKALEKQPERRYQNASDVKEAVSRATTSATSVESYKPTVITPAPAKKRPAWVPVTIVGILALLAVPIILALKRPGPNVVTVPPDPKPAAVPAGPLDLTPLYFGPEERPLRYVLARTDASFPRNPLPAKEGPEIDLLIRFLGDIGLQNLDRSEIKQGYLAVWWGGTTAFVAIETPVAERIERAFGEIARLENRWTHRKDNLLVLAWSPRRERRDVFNDLVGRLQKKLGLPVETPPVPLENLKAEKGDLDKAWTPADAGREAVLEGPGTYSVAFQKGDQAPAIFLSAFLAPTVAEAEALAARHRTTPGGPDVRRKEVLRTSRTVTILVLRSDDVGPYEKFAEDVRQWMGLPKRTFDTIVPAAAELPAGYSFDKVLTDVHAVLQEVAISGILASTIKRAWHARLKPAGTITLFEVPGDLQVRSDLEQQLRKRGPAWSGDEWVWGVEGPDDETLDAVENRMREKFGYDRNSPRSIQLHHARLVPADLPEGFTLENEKMDRKSFSCELKGPQLVFKCTILQTFDYGKVREARKEMKPAPGDVFLLKDTVVAHVAGPEAGWAMLDRFEAILRKKMRMGPATADEFAVASWELPSGSLFTKPDHVPEPNPNFAQDAQEMSFIARRLGIPATDLADAWSARVEPSGTQLMAVQLRDAGKVEGLSAMLKKNWAGAKNLAVYLRGPYLALAVQLEKADEASFKTLSEMLRGKLRLAGK